MTDDFNKTENDFKLHIKWYNREKTEGIATLTDNGQPLLETECIEDARLLRDLLNELNNENEQLKHQRQEWINESAVFALQYKAMREDIQNYHQTLDDMIESERTELGRSVLKQFKEAIQ